MILVRNGGQDGTSGYYKWVIASTSQVIYEGKGRLTGIASQLQSLWPELVAYLACTTFLLHYVETKNTKICSKLQHYAENMTLVQRVMSYNRKELPNQGVVLRPEMDVQL